MTHEPIINILKLGELILWYNFIKLQESKGVRMITELNKEYPLVTLEVYASQHNFDIRIPTGELDQKGTPSRYLILDNGEEVEKYKWNGALSSTSPVYVRII